MLSEQSVLYGGVGILLVLLLILLILVVVIIVLLAKGAKSRKQKPENVASEEPPSRSEEEEAEEEDGEAETQLLGQSKPVGELVCVRTKEAATIDHTDYKIGKERKNVDFCIMDNTAISRIHASIVIRNDAYFIVDNRSTNYTFVNGKRIQPGREIPLRSGDEIVMADEEFVFSIRS